jgi:colanic acid biosynthesis glycosyl transferase WcaI
LSKRFLFIAGNFSPESTGIGKYNGEMAEWLAAKGIYCTVVTTFPYYPQWKVAEPYKKRSYWYKKEVKTINGTPLTTIRCPHYVPKKPTAFKRFISDLTIFFSTSLVIVKYFFATRFDHLIVVSPPLLTGLTGLVYKKIKGAAFLYHIQDLQVDAARDLHMLRSKWLLKILFSVERMILQQADIISTVSEGMAEKVKKKTGSLLSFFLTGVIQDRFTHCPAGMKLKGNMDFALTARSFYTPAP